MYTITLRYTVPQAPGLKLAAQVAALHALALESPGSNDELSFLGLTETARTETPQAGPPATILFEVVYTSNAAFDALYPTAAKASRAVTNLWTGRISIALATRCTASTPIIV
jgi:hypothetical protein